MKHFYSFLWIMCGILCSHAAFAQQGEYSPWSLDLKGGLNRGEHASGLLSKEGWGLTFGLEVERTLNPLWGLAAGYTYLGYAHSNINGSAHEVTGLASLNVLNLVEKHRKGKWQLLNIYGRLGGGFSLFNAASKGVTLVVPIGASIEYNVTQGLAISLNGERRWHLSNSMGFASSFQDKMAFWGATVGLRFKLGKKSHVRNANLNDHEASNASVYYIDDAALQEQINNHADAIAELQDQLNKANNDLNRTKADLNRANEKIATWNSAASASARAPMRFENIEYEAGEYGILSFYRNRLDDLSVTLKEHPDVKVEIVGHSDALGQEARNKALSLKRAEVVKDYLVEKGIDAARITAKGMSDTQPVAPNTTSVGRQKNRRVEVFFSNNQ